MQTFTWNRNLGILKIVFWLLLFQTIADAQSIPFRVYSPHDGLPQSQVISLFQDSRGYLWVGTRAGLAYFDGISFHVLDAKDGIPSAQITQIQEDAAGNVLFYSGRWLCTYNGESVSYDTTAIRFKDAVFCMDASKMLWSINRNDDQPYWSKDGKIWNKAADNCPALLGKKWKYLLYSKSRKRLVISDENHALFVLQGNALLPLADGTGNPVLTLNRHAPDLGIRNDSVFEVLDQSSNFLFRGRSSIAHALRRTGGDVFYICQFTNHLFRRSPAGKLDSVDLGIPPTFLFLDRNQNLWVGAEGGLIRVFTDGFQNYSKEELSGVWSMVEDKTGNMWFGEYYYHQLKRYNGTVFEPIKINYGFVPTLNKGDLGDFYFGGGTDNKGNLYFPCGFGVKKYDGERFSMLPAQEDPNSPNISLYLIVDTVSNLIVSGTKAGVNIVDLPSGKRRFFGPEKGMQPCSFVLGAAKDGNGQYWLATGRGLAVLDLARDSITKNYVRELGNFPYFGTMCVFSDYKGNIWAGSANALLWYDAAKDSFIRVASDFVLGNINCLAGLNHDYLIVGTNKGICFLDLKTFYNEGKTKVRFFNQHNGFTGIEPNQNCLFVDSKQNIWVSSSDIVTKITPSELQMSASPLMLYITEINNQRIRYESYNKTFDLPSGTNTAKIRFEAVGFERPMETEFSYKTDDGPWSAWRTEDFAILNDLSSGNYRFSVRTRQAGTVDDQEIMTVFMQIKVRAPLAKEWWFPWAAAFAFSLLIGSGLYYVRNIRQKAQAQFTKDQSIIEEQEKRDVERSKQNKYLQIQTLQAQLNPHFIFNVLQAVQTRIYAGSRDAASSLIVDLGKLMRRFLESSVNMDLRRIRTSEITIKEEINLLESYIEFEKLQYSNRFDYAIVVDPELDVENTRFPPMLVQPYVENAIKHGVLYETQRRCSIKVSFLKTSDERLICTVADTGVGRKKAKELQEQHIRMYKSRGTEILEERIKIMQELGIGIQVTVEDYPTADNPDGGTLVTLVIDM